MHLLPLLANKLLKSLVRYQLDKFFSFSLVRETNIFGLLGPTLFTSQISLIFNIIAAQFSTAVLKQFNSSALFLLHFDFELI